MKTEEVVKRMKTISQTLIFSAYPKIELPKALCALESSLQETLLSRRTSSEIILKALSLQEIATILHFAYGVTINKKDRPLRTSPSAGALYPLDIFLYSSHVNELKAGIYHYNPIKHLLSVIQNTDCVEEIASRMPYNLIPEKSSLIFFHNSTI